MNLDDIEGSPCICDPHPYFYYADPELETVEPTTNLEPLSTLEPPSPAPSTLSTCSSPSPEPTPLHTPLYTPLMACLESFDKNYDLKDFERKWDQLLQSSPDLPQPVFDDIVDQLTPEQLVLISKKIVPDLPTNMEIPPEDEIPSIPSISESFYVLYMSNPPGPMDLVPSPSSIPFVSLLDSSSSNLEPPSISIPPQDSMAIIKSSAPLSLPSIDLHSQPMELASIDRPCEIGVKFPGPPSPLNISYLGRLFQETKRLLTYILPTFVLHRL